MAFKPPPSFPCSTFQREGSKVCDLKIKKTIKAFKALAAVLAPVITASIAALITAVTTALMASLTAFTFLFAPAAYSATTTFSTPGTSTYTVPSGVTVLKITTSGGGGGGGGSDSGGSGGAGGAGQLVTGLLSVIPGQVLTLYIGSGGSGGSAGAGTDAAGGGGGGGGVLGGIAGPAHADNAAAASGSGGGTGSSSLSAGTITNGGAGNAGAVSASGGNGSVAITANGSTTTFSTVGASTFTVPAGVTSISIDARGGGGGGGGNDNVTGGVGGAGQRITGSLAVTPGQQFTVVVGGGGGGGGGGGAGGASLIAKGGDGGLGMSSGTGGGGGGASGVIDVATSTTVVVAGGGGGGGGASNDNVGFVGGAGGAGLTNESGGIGASGGSIGVFATGGASPFASGGAGAPPGLVGSSGSGGGGGGATAVYYQGSAVAVAGGGGGGGGGSSNSAGLAGWSGGAGTTFSGASKGQNGGQNNADSGGGGGGGGGVLGGVGGPAHLDGQAAISAAGGGSGSTTLSSGVVGTGGGSAGGATATAGTAGYVTIDFCKGTALGIANACAWYKADTGVSAGSDWADQSTSGNTATKTGTPASDGSFVTYAAAAVSISGKVFDDPSAVADSSAAAGTTGISGAKVWLFNSAGVWQNLTALGIPGASGGGMLTDASGNYTISGISSGTYFVTVDAPGNATANSAIREQTWASSGTGAVGANADNATNATTRSGPICVGAAPTYTDNNNATVTNWTSGASGPNALNTAGATSGFCYGGRRGATGDTIGSGGVLVKEHVTRVVADSAVTGVDFGFSYNVVTNTNEATTCPTTGDGVVVSCQGSLRQFVNNANAISGANAMRFVPAVAPNQPSGSPLSSNTWWRIAATASFGLNTNSTNGDNTTVDGKAYSNTDGSTVRDTLSGNIVESQIVGTESKTAPAVARPELELVTSTTTGNYQLINIAANSASIRNVAVNNYDVTNAVASIYQSSGNNLLLENNVIGVPPNSTMAAAPANTSSRFGIWLAPSAGVTLASPIVRNSLFAYTKGENFSSWNISTGAVNGLSFVGNQIINVNTAQAGAWATSYFGQGTSGTTSIQENYINLATGIGNSGLQLENNAGTFVVQNNTISKAGASSGVASSGVLITTTSGTVTVEKNIISDTEACSASCQAGAGSGIVVLSGATSTNTIQNNQITGSAAAGIAVQNSATKVKISQNTFSGNTGNSIDLGANGVTATSAGLNGSNCSANNNGGTSANGGLARPIINTAETSGGSLTVSGFVCNTGASVVELYETTAGTGDYGQYDFSSNACSSANGPETATCRAAGEGTRYLGSISVASGGTFSGTITASGLSASSRISATDTKDGLRTSELSYSVQPIVKCEGAALSLGNACVWFKANNGATASSWIDSKTGGVDMTATGFNSPVKNDNRYNFNPTVSFNGAAPFNVSSAYYSLPTGFGDFSLGLEAFVVAKPLNSGARSWQRFFDIGNGEANAAIVFAQFWNQNLFIYEAWNSANVGGHVPFNGTGTTLSNTLPQIYEANHLASSTTATVRSNGGNPLSGTTGLIPKINRGVNYIGRSNWAQDAMYEGDIAEVILYSKAMSAADRVKVESYLALKYGITLTRAGLPANAYVNSSGAVVFEDATNTYWNNVFGIAKDATTSLDQRVSKSVNPYAAGLGGVMTLATNDNFTDANGASRSDTLTNGQYLILGDNNLNSTTMTAKALGIVAANNRISRVWKAKNTLSVQNTYIGLPTTNAPTTWTTDTTKDKYLIVESGAGADGTFPLSRTTSYLLKNLNNFWVPVDNSAATAGKAVTIPDGAYLSYAEATPPKMTWIKALDGAGRINAADQFKLDIRASDINGAVQATVTTAGAAAAITAGTEKIIFTPTPGVTYNLSESMAAGSVSTLSLYGQTLACSNTLTVANGGTDVSALTSYTAATGLMITPTYGDDITCTLTNKPQNPIIKVRKAFDVVVGRIDPADQFTLILSQGATQVDSHTTAGTGTADTNLTNISYQAALGGATAYTISEVKAAGASPLNYYTAKVTCTVSGVSGSAAEENLPYTFTPVDGQLWDCVVSNTPKEPQITLTKTLGSPGRIVAADQFTLSAKVGTAGGANAATPVTTTGAGTAVDSGGVLTLDGNAGTSYYLSEAMSGAGAQSPLTYYHQTLSCANNGGPTNVTGFTTLPATIATAYGDDIACTLTNTPQPVVKIGKRVGLRVTSGDKFTVGVESALGAGLHIIAGTASYTTNNTCTTNCGGTDEIRLEHGKSYWLYDATTSDSITPIGGYGRTLSCTNATTTSSSALVASADLTLNTSVTPNRVQASITPQAGDDITCEFANSARPALTLRKSVALLATPLDSFELSIVDPSNQSGVIDESGSYNTKTYTTTAGEVQGSVIVKILGSSTEAKSYTLREKVASGAPMSSYATTLSCTNSNVTAGATNVTSATWTQNGDYRQTTITLNQYGADPINAGSSLDNIDCIFTNAASLPKITIKTKTLDGTATFSYTGGNGFDNSTVTTSSVGVEATATNPQQFLDASGVETRILQTAPSGWSVASVSCTDTNGAITGNGTGSLGVYHPTDGLILPASEVKPGADLVCTFTNQKGGSFVKGTVFEDNGAGGGSGGVAYDGVQNGAEKGLANVLMKLVNCSSNAVMSQTSTDGSGNYSLTVPVNTPNGSLCVEQQNLVNYRSVSATPSLAASYNQGLDRITLAWAGVAISDVDFGDVPASRLENASIKIIKPGSTVDHVHKFVAGAAGSVTFSITNTQTTPNLMGWAEVLYRDADCDGVNDSSKGDEPISANPTVAVTAGQEVCLLVRHIAPLSAPEGAKRSFTLQAVMSHTAQATYSGSAQAVTETLTQNDSSSVSQQSLSLLKQVCNQSTAAGSCSLDSDWSTGNSAKPGQTVVYRIRFGNEGTSAISDLVIRDTTPSYTTFLEASCPSPPPAALSNCETPSAANGKGPAVGGVGSLVWEFTGTLSPSSAGEVRFKVKVD